VVIRDAELSGPRLAQEVGRLLADPSALDAMARASAELARPDAARQIAHEVLAAAGITPVAIAGPIASDRR